MSVYLQSEMSSQAARAWKEVRLEFPKVNKYAGIARVLKCMCTNPKNITNEAKRIELELIADAGDPLINGSTKPWTMKLS